MKYILILPIIAFAMAALAVPSQRAASTSQRRVALAPQQDTQQNTSGRKIPCKTPENAAMCYSTRGRLSFYNGNPPYRLWRIGTKRMLGIYSGPSVWPPKDQRDQDNPEL